MHLNPTWLQTSSSLSVFPGFQSRLCRCWRAGGCGRSSSSLCSWTRRTGRARAADRASTSWSMSSRGEPVSSSLTSPLTGSSHHDECVMRVAAFRRTHHWDTQRKLWLDPFDFLLQDTGALTTKTSAKVWKYCNLCQFFNTSLYQ